MKPRRKKMVQMELPERRWGGRRKGAGRPVTKGVVLHRPRPQLKARFPLHVTLKVLDEVGSLRTDKRFLRIKRAFLYGCDKFGMRLVHFSVQGNHVHLIVEAADKLALTRGMQGLTIRLAKGVNRVSNRHGRVFADRYHARVLKTPTEVRNAIHYVLKNLHKHRRVHPGTVDVFSSVAGEACYLGKDRVIVDARTWLLKSAIGILPGLLNAGKRRAV
jgi:putative transposase